MIKARRIYSGEYKIEAIRLVTQQGMSHREAARKLGIRESMLRRWQTQEAQGGEDPLLDEISRRLQQPITCEALFSLRWRVT